MPRVPESQPTVHAALLIYWRLKLTLPGDLQQRTNQIKAATFGNQISRQLTTAKRLLFSSQSLKLQNTACYYSSEMHISVNTNNPFHL